MNDEEEAAESLFARGMSSDAGLEPLGEKAPVSLLGLISRGVPLLPSFKRHCGGGGTARRGREWSPRGEPEEGGAAVFFIFLSSFRSSGRQKRKKGLNRK